MKITYRIVLIMISLFFFLGCPSPHNSPDNQTISLLSIPGLTVPVLGGTPVTSIDSSQYTGTISWSPAISATFAESTVYTATITLSPKPRYTLTGVTANSFTVAGASSVIHNANSGVVTAVFPSTLFNLSMITVPAGSFQRDATATNISVITQSYKISKNEITRAQFFAIMGTDPSDLTHSTGTSTDPVQHVNWYQAIVFCNRLSIIEGLSPVYSIGGSTNPTNWGDIPLSSKPAWDSVTANWSASGYRLPTEMEWMWAAMGATNDRSNGYSGIGVNTTGYLKGYAGSIETGGSMTNFKDYAWFKTNSNENTHPIAGKLPNELGISDMNGNVQEWCWDWYSDNGTYPNYAITGLQTDYQGGISGTYRVKRGASWNADVDNSPYVAYRYRYLAYYADAQDGLRLVRR